MIEKIGIIGGGQLGMMMTEAAHLLGYKVTTLDPTPQSPAGQIADEEIIAAYDDEVSLASLCEKTDVVTYEFENVPYTSVQKFKEQYNIPQGEMPLYLSQDRLREKEAAHKAGATCGPYSAVDSKEALVAGLAELGYPCVLKTCSGGYDGKGQVVLRSEEDIPTAALLAEKQSCILEKFIHFQCEISVIVTRSMSGEMTTLPVTQNIHRNNILFMSIAPAPINPAIVTKAEAMARTMMENFGFVGTLAIEMFVVEDGVIFNEMAPRPHNSGHYSIEGCITSQFEQHVRAITGMPLGETTLKQPTIMVNYLGQHVEAVQKIVGCNLPNVYIHDYGKAQPAHNRKMGHITFTHYSVQEVEAIIAEIV